MYINLGVLRANQRGHCKVSSCWRELAQRQGDCLMYTKESELATISKQSGKVRDSCGSESWRGLFALWGIHRCASSRFWTIQPHCTETDVERLSDGVNK